MKEKASQEKVELFIMPRSGWLCREQERAQGTGNKHGLGEGDKDYFRV